MKKMKYYEYIINNKFEGKAGARASIGLLELYQGCNLFPPVLS
jgi:hypothetical protein